jgi:hypothetical protein
VVERQTAECDKRQTAEEEEEEWRKPMLRKRRRRRRRIRRLSKRGKAEQYELRPHPNRESIIINQIGNRNHTLRRPLPILIPTTRFKHIPTPAPLTPRGGPLLHPDLFDAQGIDFCPSRVLIFVVI